MASLKNMPSVKPARRLVRLEKLLLAIVLLLVLVIAAGTLWALASRKKTALTVPVTPASQETSSETGIFTALGKVRASSGGSRPAVVIISVVFPYTKSDISFTEELVAHTKELRQLVTTVIGSIPAEQLKKMPETELKTTLLTRFNSVLRLGQIQTLYFTDFIVLD